MEIIISGIGMGIVLSFLTGPVFFALIKTSIEKGFYSGMALAAGVVIADGIFVALSLYGSSYLNTESKNLQYIGYAGAVILFSIGIYYLFKKVTISYEPSTSRTKKLGYFLKGFAMCVFNPSLLLYWISVTSGVISVAGGYNPQIIIPFFATILITQFSLDTLKAYYANKLRKKITEKTLVKLNRIAGGLIVIFALKLVYSLIVSHSII
ncbi:MAG: LysE family translocator [Sphingobacteriaceae bacterium]